MNDIRNETKNLSSIFLVTRDPNDAQKLRDSFARNNSPKLAISSVQKAFSARICGNDKNVANTVLFELQFNGNEHLDVFSRILASVPKAMIIISSADYDETTTRQVMQHNAFDYVFKYHAHWIPLSMHFFKEHQVAMDALRYNELTFKALSEASAVGLYISDVQGKCVFVNDSYKTITENKAPDNFWNESIHPTDKPRLLLEWKHARRSHVTLRAEGRLLFNDRRLVWVNITATPIHKSSISNSFVYTLEDVSEKKSLEQRLSELESELFEEKERTRVTYDAVGEAIICCDKNGRVTSMNGVAEKITGWSLREALGLEHTQVFNIVNATSHAKAESPASKAIEQNKIVELAINSVLIRRDNKEIPIEDSASPIYDKKGKVTGAIIVFHDVSESRTITAKMAYHAQHDFLTGLPNRILLEERFKTALAFARRHQTPIALLFLDLDHFKHINDSLGHHIGDLLLKSVTSRIRACIRETDTVCRLGGDEFVILLSEIGETDDAAVFAEKLRSSLAEVHRINEHELYAGSSIGISIYPEDGNTLVALMQNADAAMYFVKANGRNNYQYFKFEMNTRATQRCAIENSLRRAIELKEFYLLYQPQFDIASQELVAMEALIRWRDPDVGIRNPTQFISVAKDCGLIVPIGTWVLREACRQIKIWTDMGFHIPPVSINISSVELMNDNFLPNVEAVINESGVSPKYLDFEITESILVQDLNSSNSTLMELKKLGIKITIDDFGTGNSSLSYLKRLPINTLKIHQSLIKDMVSNSDDATIVSAIVGLGKSLNLRVIAEGIENADQLELLLSQHCEIGQGFFCSPPLTSNEFCAVLKIENEKNSG